MTAIRATRPWASTRLGTRTSRPATRAARAAIDRGLMGRSLDDPLRPEPRDLLLESKLTEHVVGIGAELGRRTTHATRCLAQLDGKARHAHGPPAGMLHLEEHLLCAHLGIVE